MKHTVTHQITLTKSQILRILIDTLKLPESTRLDEVLISDGCEDRFGGGYGTKVLSTVNLTYISEV